MPPPRVRLRIFQNAKGVCHISGRKIREGEAWHLEHVKAIIDGGHNSEDNLLPALVEPHKQKTEAERKRKKKADRTAKKALGIKIEPRHTIPQRPKEEKFPRDRISLPERRRDAFNRPI